MHFDYRGMKGFIGYKGYLFFKHCAVLVKSGMPKTKLNQILNGNRKCEAGDYASICKALNVPYEKFIKEGWFVSDANQPST